MEKRQRSKIAASDSPSQVQFNEDLNNSQFAGFPNDASISIDRTMWQYDQNASRDIGSKTEEKNNADGSSNLSTELKNHQNMTLDYGKIHHESYQQQ